MAEKECGIKEFMNSIPQAFHLTFRNAWVSIGKLSYIICRNTYFFTFVKTNHYVRRPDKKVRHPRFSIQKDCIRQILQARVYRIQ